MDRGAPSPRGEETQGEAVVLALVAFTMALSGAFLLPPLLFVAPVPLALLVYRQSIRTGIVVAIGSALLVTLLQRATLAGTSAVFPEEFARIYLLAMVVALFTSGLVGITLGGAWRDGYNASATFLMGTLAVLVPVALFWIGAHSVLGTDPATEAFAQWQGFAERLVEEGQDAGVPAEFRQQMESFLVQAEEGFHLLSPLLPALLATMAFAGSFTNMLLTRWVLLRWGDSTTWFPPFAEWRFPWFLALGFILGHGLLLVGDAGAPLAVMGANLQVFFSNVFLVQGMAIAWFFLQGRRIARFWRLLVVFLLFLMAPSLAVWGGVLDTWFNFRKLQTPDEG